MIQKKIPLLCGIIFATQLSANNLSETTIVPDRPGFSTGTYTVQPGKMNIEMGYEYSFGIDDTNTQTLPLFVARTGITPILELDIMWDGISIDQQSNNSERNWSESVAVGGKYRLLENSKYNFTFLGLVSLPINGQNLNTKNIDFLGGLLWDYTYSENAGLFGTIQTSSYQENESKEYDIQIAVGSSFSHTDKLSTFIEVYTIVPFRDTHQKEEVFDAGAMYLISNNIQVDVNFGIGLNAISSDFIGAGFAIQF